MTEDITSLNRSAYDQVAGQFAAANSDMSESLQQSALRMLARKGEQRLLDVGCGTGRDLAWMYRREPGRFYGSDLSMGMLREAKERAEAVFTQADMRLLPYASGSFGGLWCCAALLHLPRAQAPSALAEMARVLDPGGWLFLSVQAGTGEGLERSPYNPPVERYFTRYQPEAMAALLEAAGLKIYDRGEELGHRHWLWFEAQKPA